MKLILFKRSFIAATLLLCATSLFATIPAGYYYFSQQKTAAELKSSLAEHAAPISVLLYGGQGEGYTWEGFFKVDSRADGSVWDMYSNTVRQFNGYRSVSGMHIEHSLPKSWWGSHANYAYRDLFHLYPSDGKTNSTKNDLPLGEVNNPTFDNGVSKIGVNVFGNDYNGRCFEPADEYKGDFARSYFYISTIYESFDQLWRSPMMDNNTYPVWKPWALDLLLKWHQQDPVSDKELARNEAIYAIQGNRNPFIDHPDLVTYIWGDSIGKFYPFPAETKPFLLFPRAGNVLDFGVILKNNTTTETIELRAVNLTEQIKLSLLNGSNFKLSTTTLNQQDAELGTSFQITFVPKKTGTIRDTLLIVSGGLDSLRIPLKALSSKKFMTLEPSDETPIGGTLRWISDADAIDYKISVYQGDTAAGDLFISTYVEGSSFNKAIELFNGTGQTIDLSDYSLRKQSNGNGAFAGDFVLSGNLAHLSTCVVAHKKCNDVLRAKSTLFTDSVLSFNGNDAVGLYRDGLMIDVVGHADDGGIDFWGDERTLVRRSQVTHPRKTYHETEWDTYAQDVFSMLGSHNIDLVQNVSCIVCSQSTDAQNTYIVNQLEPEQTYTYCVEAITTSGIQRTVNTSQIHTTGLETPVVMEATDVTHHSFCANWEITPYATNYLLDVYKMQKKGQNTNIFDFNSVGSNGKPLPSQWVGTASGNYTSAISSGVSPNSIAFKNDGEYIQTATYNTPISHLSFMYRFPSSGAGNILVLDALCGDQWENIDSLRHENTSKYYPEYDFATEQNVRAFKFTFFKAGGNLALDDISITYEDLDTIFVAQNLNVASNSYVINELNAKENYFYTVRAMRGTSISQYSEVQQVETFGETAQIMDAFSTIRIISSGTISRLEGLQPADQVSVFSITGKCLFRQQTTTSALNLPNLPSGIYLIQVKNHATTQTFKIIR